MDTIFEIHPKLREDMLSEVKKRKEQNEARFQTTVNAARNVLKFSARLRSMSPKEGVKKAGALAKRFSCKGGKSKAPAGPPSPEGSSISKEPAQDTCCGAGVFSASALMYRTVEVESSVEEEPGLYNPSVLSDCLGGDACSSQSQSAVTSFQPQPVPAGEAGSLAAAGGQEPASGS